MWTSERRRLMLGRVPMRDVQSLDDVIAFLESTDGEKVIISDIDNTLAPQDVAPEEFAVLVNAAIDRIEAHRNVARVIALTNGPQRQVARIVSRGNKPWTTCGGRIFGRAPDQGKRDRLDSCFPSHSRQNGVAVEVDLTMALV